MARRSRTAAPDGLASGRDDAGGPPTVAVEAVATPPEGVRIPRARLRARVLPRTVLGLAMLILAASIGAAFSGAVFFSYYQYRQQRSDDRVNALIGSYKKEFDKASADLAAQSEAAKAQINQQLAPLRQIQTSADTLQALIRKVAPSVWFVHTLDVNGQPSVGSAFAVASDQSQTLLLASYATVLADTRTPAPELFVRQGTADTRVSVWTWDEHNDLALLILPKGGIPVLQPATAAPAIGDRVYAVSGLGSLGSSATDGIVTDVSASDIQHTAAVGQAFQGGPLLDATGGLLGISSRSFQPLNFPSDAVWFSPYIRAACEKVLQCPAAGLGGVPGVRRGG